MLQVPLLFHNPALEKQFPMNHIYTDVLELRIFLLLRSLTAGPKVPQFHIMTTCLPSVCYKTSPTAWLLDQEVRVT